MQETKICKACKQEKTLDNFYFRNETGKYRGCCKQCKSIRTKAEIAASLAADTKVCKVCGIEKPVTEYQKAGKGKWLQPYCKPCDADRKRKHLDENKEQIQQRRRDFYQANKDVIKERTKEYSKQNKEANRVRIKRYRQKEEVKIKNRGYGKANRKKITAKHRQTRNENREFYQHKGKQLRAKRTPEQIEAMRAYQKAYRMGNKEKIAAQRAEKADVIREKKRLWCNEKSANDIEFRLLKNMRARIRFALKRHDTVKSDTTESLLGCTVPAFKTYFESLFAAGMTWAAFMSGDIHIDHKKPCVLFDLTKEQEQRECFHYTNLQPLWGQDNLKKGSSYTPPNKYE